MIAAVSEAKHDEDIGKPGDTEADAPRAMRIRGLFRKRKSRCVDDVIEQPRGDPRGVRKVL